MCESSAEPAHGGETTVLASRHASRVGAVVKPLALPVSLEALAERAKDGDREALESLLFEIQDDIYRLAMRMLGLRAEAEDATQEILVKVMTHLADFRGESAFKTWVWTIAIR